MPHDDKNIRRHDGTVTRADREALLGQRGGVVWFTGLSGSGKSTVARAVEAALGATGRLVYVLDGESVRAIDLHKRRDLTVFLAGIRTDHFRSVVIRNDLIALVLFLDRVEV